MEDELLLNNEIFNSITILIFLFSSVFISSIGIISTIGGNIVLNLDLGDIVTAVATLFGAAGGAWLSGKNAVRLWNIQEDKTRKSKESLFNNVLYAEIKRFEIDYFELLKDLTEADEVFDNPLEYKELLLQMYSKHNKSIKSATIIFSNAYSEVKNLIHSGVIDIGMYTKLATIHIKIKPLIQLEGMSTSEKGEIYFDNLTKEEVLQLEILTGLNLGRLLIIDLFNYFNENKLAPKE